MYKGVLSVDLKFNKTSCDQGYGNICPSLFKLLKTPILKYF